MSQEAIETLKKVNKSIKEMKPKVKKTLYLGVYKTRASYIDGETIIGIYDAESYEEAVETMVESMVKDMEKSYRQEYKDMFKKDIRVTPLNGRPIKVVTEPTGYEG